MTTSNKKMQHDDGKIVYKKLCTTRKEAIRIFCMECMGMDRREPMPKSFDVRGIRECPDSECPLFPFRSGGNPFSNRKGNKAALEIARTAKARLS
jgi:hypothetical protein